MTIIVSKSTDSNPKNNNPSPRLGLIEVIRAHVEIYMSNRCQLSESVIRKQCERFSKKDIATYSGSVDLSNWLQIYILADQHSVLWLKNRAFKFALKNFLNIINTPGYKCVNNSLLSLLLQDDNLAVNCEKDVFNALIKWMRFDLSKRSADFESLINHIRVDHICNEVIIVKYYKILNSPKAAD